jgi:2'-5' RNA ligase
MLLRNDQQSVAKAARVFVGIKIAPEIAHELGQLAQGLERFPTRFVPTEDIHLTLVPPWDETSIPDAIEKLRQALNASEPFMLTFTRPAYWPDRRRPRLLCAECVPTPEITALQQALLNAFGQTEDKPFQPHVTLARLQRGGRAAAGKHEMDRELSLAQAIDSIELFRSRTQFGENYQILASLPLGAPRQRWRDILRQSLMRIAGMWKRMASAQDRESSKSGVSKCCDS